VGDNRPSPETAAATDGPVELTEDDLAFLSLAGRGPAKRRVTLAPKIPPYRDVGRLAARVLGDLPRDDVASALAVALANGDDETRQAAADSLARVAARMTVLPADAVETLRRFITSADTDLRISVVRALGSAGDGTKSPHVIGCLRDDDELVRAEAVRALAACDAAASEIRDALNDLDPGVRLASAQAIAQGGGRESIDRLVEFGLSFGGYHRRAAARLLRNLDVEAANARLLGVLNTTQRSVERQVVIEALEELNRSDVVSDEVT
jgi:HEAT repeat protein